MMVGQMIAHTDLIFIWIEIILDSISVRPLIGQLVIYGWAIVRSWGGVMTEDGSPCIVPRMTVLDIVSRHRATEAVFKRWDGRAGECICCQALFDTLQQVASRYGLDLDRLMAELTAAVDASDASH